MCKYFSPQRSGQKNAKHLEQVSQSTTVPLLGDGLVLSISLCLLGGDVLCLLTINLVLASEEISVLRLDPLALSLDLPEKVEEDEDWNTKVSGDEGSVIKLLDWLHCLPCQRGESTEDANEDTEDEGSNGSPHAERSNIRDLVVGDVLGLSGSDERDVGDEDSNPSQQTKYSHQTREVTKDLIGRLLNTQECEEAESDGETESIDWNTTVVSLLEDCWSLAFLCETVQCSGCNVKIRVCS